MRPLERRPQAPQDFFFFCFFFCFFSLFLLVLSYVLCAPLRPSALPVIIHRERRKALFRRDSNDR